MTSRSHPYFHNRGLMKNILRIHTQNQVGKKFLPT